MNTKLRDFFKQANAILVGKAGEVKLAMACLLARGHLLIEDIPGVGKTTLVHILAKGLGLQQTRIQFTSDLLPADIVGTLIFESRTNQFVVRKGPLFSQFILADELNRATPKTQSALLQAMEERTVTIDNESYSLPQPFLVFATQNPHDQAGTFPLPESQVDRFLMRISLGYPDRAAERVLLASQEDRSEMITAMLPAATAEDILSLQDQAARVHVSDAILDYIQDLLERSRGGHVPAPGLSPRAGLGLKAAARAWAFLEGRDMVLPEDVQAVAVSVISHRLQSQGSGDPRSGVQRAEALIKSVHVY